MPRTGAGRPRRRPDAVIADKAYSSRAILQALRRTLQGESEDPTDFGSFLDAGGTLYLLGKDSEVNSVAPLTTAIAEDLLDLAEAHALTSPAGRLDPALLAALDEAPNIAPIPSLRQRVADGRGRGTTVIYGPRRGRPPVPASVRTPPRNWRPSRTTSSSCPGTRTPTA